MWQFHVIMRVQNVGNAASGKKDLVQSRAIFCVSGFIQQWTLAFGPGISPRTLAFGPQGPLPLDPRPCQEASRNEVAVDLYCDCSLAQPNRCHIIVGLCICISMFLLFSPDHKSVYFFPAACFHVQDKCMRGCPRNS